MEKHRDDDGHFIVSDRFPKGMKHLGDYIHALGLKFGIYSSAGVKTCEGRAGSLGHEKTDAHDFAKWGVDYLKYDNCYNENVPAIKRYSDMRDALKETGRDIVYSICNWGEEETHTWAPHVGNSWRTTQDIFDGWASIEYNFHASNKFREASGPGGWNDPDMLEIGNGGLTIEEEKTHFTLWSIAKSPLIIGCDLTKIRP
jgi:alpha-galactosidase